jgi:hypothetical protein
MAAARVRQLLAHLEVSRLRPADFTELTRRLNEDFARAVTVRKDGQNS